MDPIKFLFGIILIGSVRSIPIFDRITEVENGTVHNTVSFYLEMVMKEGFLSDFDHGSKFNITYECHQKLDFFGNNKHEVKIELIGKTLDNKTGILFDLTKAPRTKIQITFEKGEQIFIERNSNEDLAFALVVILITFIIIVVFLLSYLCMQTSYYCNPCCDYNCKKFCNDYCNAPIQYTQGLDKNLDLTYSYV